MASLLILGAGGHGKVVADVAFESNRWEGVAFLDDAFDPQARVLGLPVLGGVADLRELRSAYSDCLVAIGNNGRRHALLEEVRDAGFSLPSLVHPGAHVSRRASVGAGCVVMAGAVVQVDSRIGDGVIVNTGATVDHDCAIADCVHICPGVHLGGNVTVGEQTWIGIGATVREGVEIGAAATIGAGAVVIGDIGPGVTATGVPAKARAR